MAGTSYSDWAQRLERQYKRKRFIVRLFVVSLIFSLGMLTQYWLDGEIRDMAQDCMKQDLSTLESALPQKHPWHNFSMPDPTEKQKASARRNLIILPKRSH